jgi:hypothetical protein
MSSSTDTVVAIKSAEKYLYRFGCPILILIGTIGCIVNLIVFTQKNLRKNPCSIYFIAYNIANFLYIYTALLSLTLNIGYNIDASIYYLVICRLRLYATVLFNCLSAFYLILASIDRVLITSRNALTRQRSTLRLAYICVSLGTLFWTLFHIHALIFTNIIQVAPNTLLCYFQPGVYLAFITYYSLIKELSALSLLTICGLWSIKNIRSTRRVIHAPDLSVSRTGVEIGLQLTSSKDRQLVFMLLMDVTIYALFSCMYAIYLIYQQITQNYMKSTNRIQIENSVRDLCWFGVGISFCSSCYANLIVSKTFRNEVKKVLLRQ